MWAWPCRKASMAQIQSKYQYYNKKQQPSERRKTDWDYLILKRPRRGGGSFRPPIGFLNLKVEVFKQQKWNFHYL